MTAGDLPIAASFWDDHGDVITAGATVLVAVVAARVVDRAIVRRGARLRARVAEEPLSPVTSTRLRLVRRLISVAIVLLGVALALSQFPAVERVATGILASSAVLGIIVGFAARQTLANAIAGILLAIAQPIRIGDLVTFEDETGTVEDVRLTYTYIRIEDGRRLVVPNERLAQSPIENHTIIDPRVRVQASIWIPWGADETRALALLGEEPGVDVSIAETTHEGVRLVAGTWARHVSERGAMEAGLKAACLRRLREEGLSSREAT
jgi:small conductance mechanosensitive channel